MYILRGPIRIGSVFGYFGARVPEDRWAIVEERELMNGGYGPASVDGKLYKTAEAARKAMEELLRKEKADE